MNYNFPGWFFTFLFSFSTITIPTATCQYSNTNVESIDIVQSPDSTASSMIRCSSGILSVFRPDNPSLSFRGPYFPEEKLRLCFEVSFWNVASGLTPPQGNTCTWLQGLIPVFYSGINIDSSLTKPSGLYDWKWFDEGSVHYNYDNDKISLVTLPNGKLGMVYGKSGLKAGDGLPAGWFYTSQGDGTGCNDARDPDQAWGFPRTCNSFSKYYFCFDVKINSIEEIIECDSLNVKGALFVFADSETGCWSAPLCQTYEPISLNGTIDCSYPINIDNHINDTICSGSGLNIEITPFHPEAQVNIIGYNNPGVEGDDVVHEAIGNYKLKDTLTNLTNDFQIVTYIVKAHYNGVTVNRHFKITLEPHGEFIFKPANSILSCFPSKCFDVVVNSINHDTFYMPVWIGPNTYIENSIAHLCPDSTTTYLVQAKDKFGCSFTENYTIHLINDTTSCTQFPTIQTNNEQITVIDGNNSCGKPTNICSQNNESAIYFKLLTPKGYFGNLSIELHGLKGGIIEQVDSLCNNITNRCDSIIVVSCNKNDCAYLLAVSSSIENAGDFQLIITQKGFQTIQGYVYIDKDQNGEFGSTDVPLEDIPIELVEGCDNNGDVIAHLKTEADGSYRFDDILPGAYFVRVPKGTYGAPDENPIPNRCCISINPYLPDTVYTCNLGYQSINCLRNPFSVDNICELAFKNALPNLNIINQWPCGRNPDEFGPWLNQAHCNGVFHNTSFIGFVAGHGDYQIEINISENCGGLQYGVYDACDPTAGPICEGDPNTGTFLIDGFIFNPCQTYILWLDGFSGVACDYTIQVRGDFHECQLPPFYGIELFDDDGLYCPSQSRITQIYAKSDPYLFSIDGVNFHWKITDPQGKVDAYIYNAQYFDYTFSEAGKYEICIQSEHPRLVFSDPFCRFFEFFPIPNQQIELNLCPFEFPFDGVFDEMGMEHFDNYGNPWRWDGGSITLDMIQNGQTHYTTIKEDSSRCSYNQNIDINVIPHGKLFHEFALCTSDLPLMFLDTLFYTEVDSFALKLVNPPPQFQCDSVLYVTTHILDIDGEIIQTPCEDNATEVRFIPNKFDPLGVDSIFITWTNPSGDIILKTNDIDQPFHVTSANNGIYTMDLTLYKLDQVCTFSFSQFIECIISSTATSEIIKSYLRPNPSSRFVEVVHDQTGEIVAVEIYDTLGKLVKTEHNSFDKIIVEDFASGIYFFKVHFDNGSIVTLPLTRI